MEDQSSNVIPAANDNAHLTDIDTQPSTSQESSKTPAYESPADPAGVRLKALLKGIPWWSVFAGVWMAGIAATLCFFVRKAVRFRKKLRVCNPITDEGVLTFIKACKKETGVKKDVAVLACDFVHAPAVFGYFKPCILVPSRFIREMDRDSLSAILLHEIYHIRCHDILAKYVWLAAKALHWFNPLVWLAFKWFEDDVELRRDQKAVQRLNADGAFIYGRSLLEAARFSRQTTHIPSSAAALFENKCKLKQRIIRLVKPHRKTKAATVVSALLALAMVVTCFTTACQPTPEQEIVVGRQEDVLSNVSAVASDDFEPIEVPDHVSGVYDDYPYLSVTYDADVVVPETAAYPVTEVTKRVFSEQDFLSYIELLIDGDYEMYSDWILTKDDYLELLTKVKQFEGTERVTQDSLDLLQQQYEKATNDTVNTPISSLDELPEDSGGQSVYFLTGDDTLARLSYTEGGNRFSYQRDASLYMASYKASSVSDEIYAENMDGDYAHYQWLQPGDPEISQEDAYTVALEYMDLLNIDLDLYSVEMCSFIKDYVDKTTGWQFKFTRAISNLQTLDTSGAFVNPDAAPSYGAPWSEESLTIAVDKNGLFGFNWNGASEISRTVVESAQLEDFDTIQQRITNQLNYICGPGGEDRGVVFEIEISKIELGISLLSVEDETDIGEYIPTWYVTYRCKYADWDDTSWAQEQIMFNAIDGSYVEPRLTNEDLMMIIDASGEGEYADSEVPEE